MKVEMRATVTVVMDFPTEHEAENWALGADVLTLLQQDAVEEDSVECWFLEDEDEDEDEE